MDSQDRPDVRVPALVPRAAARPALVDSSLLGRPPAADASGSSVNLVRLVFRAVSGDGRLAIEMFPGNAWQWSDDPNSVQLLRASNQQRAQFGGKGCDIMPPVSAADYLRRSVAPSVRQEARVLVVEPIPDVAEELQQYAQRIQQSSAAQGIRAQVRADVARLRLAYSLGGQPVEEWLTAITSSGGVPAPTYNMYTGQMGQALFYNCGADHIVALRAPQGQLDAHERFFRMVLSTVRIDPQWQARVMQVIANMTASDIKGARDRSAIIAQSNRDISNIINETYENRNRSQDRIMEGWSQYMRGVETFKNPYTGETVELPNQYGHAWAGPNGEYIVTDSGLFDPNVTLRGDWTRLEQVRR